MRSRPSHAGHSVSGVVGERLHRLELVAALGAGVLVGRHGLLRICALAGTLTIRVPIVRHRTALVQSSADAGRSAGVIDRPVPRRSCGSAGTSSSSSPSCSRATVSAAGGHPGQRPVVGAAAAAQPPPAPVHRQRRHEHQRRPRAQRVRRPAAGPPARAARAPPGQRLAGPPAPPSRGRGLAAVRAAAGARRPASAPASASGRSGPPGSVPTGTYAGHACAGAVPAYQVGRCLPTAAAAASQDRRGQ